MPTPLGTHDPRQPAQNQLLGGADPYAQHNRAIQVAQRKSRYDLLDPSQVALLRAMEPRDVGGEGYVPGFGPIPKAGDGMMRDPSNPRSMVQIPNYREIAAGDAGLKALHQKAGELMGQTQYGEAAARATRGGERAGDLDYARRIAEATQGIDPITVPGAGASGRDRLMTKEDFWNQSRGGARLPNANGGALPADPNAPAPGIPAKAGIEIGRAPDEIRAAEIRKGMQDRQVSTLTDHRKEVEVARNSATEALQLAEAGKALLPAATGKWEEFALPIKQWLVATTGMSEEQTRQVFMAEGFTGLMNKALVKSQADFKGAVSDVEFKTAAQTVPRLGNTRQTNAFQLEFMKQVAEKALKYSRNVDAIAAKANAEAAEGRFYDSDAALAKLKVLRDSSLVVNSPEIQAILSGRY